MLLRFAEHAHTFAYSLAIVVFLLLETMPPHRICRRRRWLEAPKSIKQTIAAPTAGNAPSMVARAVKS